MGTASPTTTPGAADRAEPARADTELLDWAPVPTAGPDDTVTAGATGCSSSTPRATAPPSTVPAPTP
ncbi:MAG: hypothetical protein R2734_11285 [Nocardioides sp.]